VDIAYLFYLPFCMLFVSSDKLHRRCTPYFLRDDQKFLWGLDLKDGLAELNRHYKQLPESERDRGILSFAAYPPEDNRFLVTRIFDEHLPHWRGHSGGRPPIDPEAEGRIVDELKKWSDAPEVLAEERDFDLRDADFVSTSRRVRKLKGSWYQVPKDLPANEE
jgi:hypothetical protein